MKALFTIYVLTFLYAGDNSDRKNTTSNYLLDIAPFTSDSLVNVVIEIPAGTNQKWEINKETGKI